MAEITAASTGHEPRSVPVLSCDTSSSDDNSDASATEANTSDVSSTETRTASTTNEGEGDDEYEHVQAPSATEELAAVARQRALSHGTINAFAAVLRRLGHDVPKDARTILGTERKAILEEDCTFAHFGLKKGLMQALHGQTVPPEIILQISIDGLPLFKSSGISFWPILCRITNTANSTPFLVSLFCGKGKPPVLERFLGPFLSEMTQLMEDGLICEASHCDVRLAAVVCDAPARSFVKKVKCHNAYHGCERCSQKGYFVERRVTFPDLNAPLRTDRTFRDQDDQVHHTGISPFISLNLNMIELFPLDYMHLVCLGVMRRMLRKWICGRGRLTRAQKEELSDKLRSCAAHFPQHFQRKPRGIEELDRWKATEFRAFVLYLGPVVLKGILPEHLYDHFLCLHVAMRILTSPTLHARENNYARDLLRYFVEEFGKSAFYGPEQLSYNVHSLSHLAEECLVHGPLDLFSAFPFESYLGKVKDMVRSPSKPLAQVSRRLSEHVVPTSEVRTVQHKVRQGDCFLVNESPVVIVKVTTDTCETAALLNRRDFFTVPFPSSSLGTIRTGSMQPKTHVWPLAALNNAVQCVMLPYNMGYVVTPLQHQW